MRDPWILQGPARKPGRCRLLCLPYAGGGASLFATWSLSPSAEVLPIQLPGRENRLRERPFTNLQELVTALLHAVAGQLCGPWAVFGHSFGGLLGYELARAAIRDGYQQPEAVFVSASRPPDVPSRFSKTLHTLPDDELVEALEAELGASTTPILTDPETRKLVLPGVRADIQVCETYRHVSDDVLEAPIIAFSGTEDRAANPVEMKRWREFTHGPFEQRVVPGGHYFLKSDPASIATLVREHLDGRHAVVR